MKSDELKEDVVRGIKLEMVIIPAGKFIMGSPESEVGHNDYETQHEVTITRAYYMGKYEVTQEQWQVVMGDNPSAIKGAWLPVTNVSRNGCKKFIQHLNEITKSKYRLPTEAEWEYACRAGSTKAYSFGNKITPKDANYNDSKIGKPVAVGSYKPNAFGLCDMHGNVYEWCEDWHHTYQAGPATDPKGKANASPFGPFGCMSHKSRVLRGGSFSDTKSEARSSNRHYYLSPPYRFNDVGFRLARTP